MSAPKYEAVGPISRFDADNALENAAPDVIARTLIALGLHEEDWRYVQQSALRFLSSGNEIVVSAAILALAHTARVNKSIDLNVVIPALQGVATDPRYTGKAQDALDDIDRFVHRS